MVVVLRYESIDGRERDEVLGKPGGEHSLGHGVTRGGDTWVTQDE